jgi:PAS domain S-box-containing protein
MPQALIDSTRVWTRMSPADRTRLAAHAAALGAVAIAALVRWALGIPGDAAPFLFFTAAVALIGSIGGAAPAATAILASLLLARVVSAAPWLLCLLFAIEAGAVTVIVERLSRALGLNRDWLESADASLRGHRATERRGRVVAAAFDRLQQASPERVVITLDREGRIADWGASAVRLYGVSGERVIGSSGAELFGPAAGAEAYASILADARTGTPARSRRRHVRQDGTPFDVEIELHALPPAAGDGFTLVIHDLSSQQAWELSARLAAERQQALREEADLAQRQMSSLRNVTDASLDAMPSVDGAAALLERLRAEVGADGIAVVRAREFRPSVFAAPEGLQPEPARFRAAAWAQRGLRTVMIHNDPIRVSEMTAVGWPEEVRSMIAVPVMRGGELVAMIEVAYLRGSRSTEWEISMIQMVAVRAVGMLHEVHANSGAIA